MIDIYIPVMCFYGLLMLTQLIVLKRILKNNQKQLRLMAKNVSIINTQVINQQNQKPFRKTLKYLLLNFTFAEWIGLRKCQNKVCLFFTTSVITLGCYISPSSYIYSIGGFCLSLIYFLIVNIAFCCRKKEDSKSKKIGLQQNELYLSLIFTMISLCLNATIMIQCFKNYKNTFLITFLKNLGLNFAIDHFLIRPLGYLFFSLPLSFNDTIQSYIQTKSEQYALSEQKYNKQNQIKFVNPSILQIQRNKNNKMNLEIEPKILASSNKADKFCYNKKTQPLRNIKRNRFLAPISTGKKIYQTQITLTNMISANQKLQYFQQDNDHNISFGYPDIEAQETKRKKYTKNQLASEDHKKIDDIDSKFNTIVASEEQINSFRGTQMNKIFCQTKIFQNKPCLNKLCSKQFDSKEPNFSNQVTEQNQYYQDNQKNQINIQNPLEIMFFQPFNRKGQGHTLKSKVIEQSKGKQQQVQQQYEAKNFKKQQMLKNSKNSVALKQNFLTLSQKQNKVQFRVPSLCNQTKNDCECVHSKSNIRSKQIQNRKALQIYIENQ